MFALITARVEKGKNGCRETVKKWAKKKNGQRVLRSSGGRGSILNHLCTEFNCKLKGMTQGG
jgi:hypothetical protein